MQKVMNGAYAIEYIPEKGIQIYQRVQGTTDAYEKIPSFYLLREQLRKEIKFL